MGRWVDANPGSKVTKYKFLLHKNVLIAYVLFCSLSLIKQCPISRVIEAWWTLVKAQPTLYQQQADECTAPLIQKVVIVTYDHVQ